jgi:hypothetical protein
MLEIIRFETAAVLGLSILDVCDSSSFIGLGGNSLLAISLVNGCKRDGVILDLESVLTATSLTDLSKSSRFEEGRHESKKTPFKNEQNSRCSGVSFGLSNSVAIDTVTINHASTRVLDWAPIPHMQLSFIHGGQRQAGSNIIHYYETYNIKHRSIIKKAWRKVIESEPIFRTHFNLHQGNGTLTEQDVAPFLWTEVIVDSARMFEKEVQKLHMTSNIETSFKMVILDTKLPEDSKFAIIWRVHHALMDGYSSATVLKKLRGAMQGLPVRPGRSFLSLARKLDEYRKIHRIRGEKFWAKQYKQHGEGSGLLSLPEITVAAGSEGDVMIPTEITLRLPLNELTHFSKRVGVTVASIYYAAWAMVLSKYVGSDTVICGVVFSCRSIPLEGIADTLGSMINTLPLIIALDRKQSSTEYVRYVFHSLVKLSNFQWTVPEDGYSRDFSSVLGVQLEEPLDLSRQGIPLLEKPYCRVMTNMPLNICVDGDGSATFSFCEAHYSKLNVERMAAMFQAALVTLLRPQQTLGLCLQGLLPLGHQKRLLAMGNCSSPSTKSSSVSEDLVSLFERCTRIFPTTVALQQGSEVLTYAELDDLASLVANFLSSVVDPGAIVCVHADRSMNWIIAASFPLSSSYILVE